MNLRKISTSLFIGLAGVLSYADLLAASTNQPPASAADMAFESLDTADQAQSQASLLFHQAQELMAKAKDAAAPAEFIALRQRVIALCQQATQLQPDFTQAYRRSAFCLLDLAAGSRDATQRRAYVRSALEQGAAADQCASATWDQIRPWASILVEQLDALAPDPSDRPVILEATCKSFERSLQKVSFASQRPPIELELADCLYRLSIVTTDPAARRGLYEQVVARFNAAAAKKPELITGPIDNVWGSVCLLLGGPTKDVAILRQGIEHLERGVEATHDVGEVRYNLSCSYALLGEREAALRHLRVCLENDRGQIKETASADPDLASLRGTPEFVELLKAKPAGLDVTAVFRKGQMSQQLAEEAKENSDALKQFGEAVKVYAKVVEARPDFVEAHAQWALCLFGMARRTADPQEHNRLVAAALARFDAATKCTNVTCRAYNLAGNEIFREGTLQSDVLGSGRILLQSARKYFEDGLKLATEGSDRRALERSLAQCLAALAVVTTDPKEKREVCARAVALFESSAPAVGEQTDTSLIASWGTTLMELGKIDRDPAILRRGIERLAVAIEKDPNLANEPYYYNLACAYAALNQPDQAVRHLRHCWENDPDEVYRKLSEKDRDLQSIRSSPAYKQLQADYPLAPPPP